MDASFVLIAYSYRFCVWTCIYVRGEQKTIFVVAILFSILGFLRKKKIGIPHTHNMSVDDVSCANMMIYWLGFRSIWKSAMKVYLWFMETVHFTTNNILTLINPTMWTFCEVSRWMHINRQHSQKYGDWNLLCMRRKNDFQRKLTKLESDLFEGKKSV